MKPLVLFSSLAVLCASGLLALSYEGWQDDPSALTSLSTETSRVKINPGVAVSNPPASEPATQAPSVASQKAEEKVAAVDPKQTETKPVAETAPSAKEQQPEAKPETDEAESKPTAEEAEAKGASFDIVRVEEDGSAVLAGRAMPGDKVRILIDNEVAGETQANDRGEWVVIPVSSMPAGAHQIQIETESADGEIRRAEQSVALTVPDQPGTQPLIVLSETAKPSKVLQKPAAAEVKQAEVVQSTPSTETTAATGDSAENTAVVKEESSSASAGQPAPETKTAALEPPVAATEPTTTVPTERKLAVDVVDYDEAGLTTFSGRSAPGSRVRVYVDNRFVGEAPAASDGTWSFTAGSEISSGPHTLRTDEISSTGEVSARIELPFFRESPERIANLQAQREIAAAEQDSEKPQSAPETVTQPGATSEVAASDAREESGPSEEPGKPAEAKSTMTDEAVAAAEPEDNATAVQEEKVAAPEQAEAVATQETSGRKADAETVMPPAAPTTPESSASQQVAAADAATKSIEAEAPQQPVTMESATESDKPEASQQTAAAETAPEPAKPENQQATAVETEDESAMPEANQQVAVTAPDMQQKKSEQETLKAATSQSTITGDGVVTATVTPVPEKAEAAPVTGRVVIQPGNNLWQISRVIYGKGRQYTVIYEANKSQIRDPDMIYPGQIFDTPGSNAPESIDPACHRPLAECE